MNKNTLNLNVTGKAKTILEEIHERTNKSYTEAIVEMHKNSPKPLDIINNTIDELKDKLGSGGYEGILERVRVILVRSYQNQKELDAIYPMLEDVMKQIGEIEDDNANQR